MSRRRFTIQSAVTLSAAQIVAGSNTLHGTFKKLGVEGAKRLLAFLHVASHDNTDGTETYQFYLTTGMVLPSGQECYWDIGAFAIVSGANAVVGQAMFVNGEGDTPTTVIANGAVTSVASNHDLGTDFNTRGTITTAVVRHGFIGDWLGWTLVAGGATPGPITFELGALIWS